MPWKLENLCRPKKHSKHALQSARSTRLAMNLQAQQTISSYMRKTGLSWCSRRPRLTRLVMEYMLQELTFKPLIRPSPLNFQRMQLEGLCKSQKMWRWSNVLMASWRTSIIKSGSRHAARPTSPHLSSTQMMAAERPCPRSQTALAELMSPNLNEMPTFARCWSLAGDGGSFPRSWTMPIQGSLSSLSEL